MDCCTRKLVADWRYMRENVRSSEGGAVAERAAASTTDPRAAGMPLGGRAGEGWRGRCELLLHLLLLLLGCWECGRLY